MSCLAVSLEVIYPITTYYFLKTHNPIPKMLGRSLKCKQNENAMICKTQTHIFCHNRTEKTYQLFKQTFYYFMTNIGSFWTDDSNVWTAFGQSHVYNCVAVLLTSVHKCLRTEDSSCWTSGKWTVSHFCLIYDASYSTVLGLLCHILHFMMCQMFSTSETGLIWTADRPVHHRFFYNEE